MPFGLKNVGAAFQRAMTFSFYDIKRIIEVYLDDLAAHSCLRVRHPYHLRLVFESCRHYQVCLNHHKWIFCVKVGHLLGFIVSKEDIRVDPLKVEELLYLSSMCIIDIFNVYKESRTSCEGSWSILGIWIKNSCVCWRKTPLFTGMSEPMSLLIL